MRAWPLLAILAAGGIAAQESGGWRQVDQQADQPAAAQNLSETQIQDIITQFAAKETEFARAR